MIKKLTEDWHGTPIEMKAGLKTYLFSSENLKYEKSKHF